MDGARREHLDEVFVHMATDVVVSDGAKNLASIDAATRSRSSIRWLLTWLKPSESRTLIKKLVRLSSLSGLRASGYGENRFPSGGMVVDAGRAHCSTLIWWSFSNATATSSRACVRSHALTSTVSHGLGMRLGMPNSEQKSRCSRTGSGLYFLGWLRGR